MKGSFLNQSNFPMLWEIFQYWVGGTIGKRKLCLDKYDNHRNVLEVGCSVGNTAKAFLNKPINCFTGIDIDEKVISYAKKKFRKHKHFNFICEDLAEFAIKEKLNSKYDFILFSSMMHHINDNVCDDYLDSVVDILSLSGSLIVVDLLLPEKEDNKFIHWNMNLELGQNVRSHSEMIL